MKEQALAKINEDLEALNKGWQIELEKKEKVIDLMARCIDTELSSERLGIILNKNVSPLKSYKEEVKQYFERKVEG